MVYTIIAEARSGGSALMDWLGESYPHFSLAQEPWLPGSQNFTDSQDLRDVDWIDNHENIFIREIFYEDRDYEPLLNKSTAVICLYRKNWYAQTRSTLFVAKDSNEWRFSYTQKEMKDLVSEYEIYENYLCVVKKRKEIFLKWINEKKLPIIYYEDLYYGNAIESVKKVFNLNTDKIFPPYKRHLRDDNDVEKEIDLEIPPPEPTLLDLVKMGGKLI